VHNLEGIVLFVLSVPTLLSPTSPGDINPVRKKKHRNMKGGGEVKEKKVK
jgi:hypothetical protein